MTCWPLKNFQIFSCLPEAMEIWLKAMSVLCNKMIDLFVISGDMNFEEKKKLKVISLEQKKNRYYFLLLQSWILEKKLRAKLEKIPIFQKIFLFFCLNSQILHFFFSNPKRKPENTLRRFHACHIIWDKLYKFPFERFSLLPQSSYIPSSNLFSCFFICIFIQPRVLYGNVLWLARSNGLVGFPAGIFKEKNKSRRWISSGFKRFILIMQTWQCQFMTHRLYVWNPDYTYNKLLVVIGGWRDQILSLLSKINAIDRFLRDVKWQGQI